MARKKGDMMRYLFGIGEGTCKDCANLMTFCAGKRRAYKCRVYGLTSSAATDWKLSEIACGMKDDPSLDEGLVMRRQWKRGDANIEGQVSLF